MIEGDRLTIFALASSAKSELDAGTTISLEGTATQWLAAQKKALITQDYAQQHQFWTEAVYVRDGLRAAIRIPLFSKGEVIGSFNVHSRQPNAYGEKEREILEQIAGPLAIAIENFRLFEQVKTAAEALQQSQEELRVMFESVAEGIFVADLQGNIIDLNEAALRIHGYSCKEEAIGRSVLDSIAEEDRARLIRGRGRVLESGSTGSIECKSLAKDGRQYDAELNAALLKDKSGNPVGFICVVRDITERKRAEEALRHSEEHFRSLIENASDIVQVIDGDGTISYASPSFERLLGYKPEELVGKNSFGFFHPDDAPEAIKNFSKVIKKGHATKAYEHRFRHKDGSWRVFEAVGKMFVDDSGAVSFVVNGRDITERKRAEEEIARHAKRQEALHTIAAAVSQTLNLEQMLNNVLVKTLEVTGTEAGYVTLVDMESWIAVVKAHSGLSKQFLGQIPRDMSEEDAHRYLEHREPAFGLHRMYSEPYLTKVSLAAEKEGLRFFVAVPLWAKDVLYGGLVLASCTPRRLSTDEVELLQAVASQIAIGMENAKLFEEARNAATIDRLTGLCNHGSFQERLAEEVRRALRYGTECSLIMLDLDYFKIHNDLFGHVAGDEALKRLGQILRDYTRQVDVACRYGGEEFAVILPHTGPLQAYNVAERLRQAVEKAFALTSGVDSTNLTVSLGVASCPSDALSREELIRRADFAMLEAKKRGRNQTCLVSEMSSIVGEKGEVEVEDAQLLKVVGPNKIYFLAAGVDAIDLHTYGHSHSVSRYAVAIGKALGLPDAEIRQLRMAALLHDIGKIGISDSIIKKPGPLDEEEKQMMRKHAELGATIISHMPELADCAPAIRHHHEWYDGSGYPSGLKGEDIPLAARIIAVADAYDTMTTPRSYRRRVSPRVALKELRRRAHTQFDPLLVAAFAPLITTGVGLPNKVASPAV